MRKQSLAHLKAGRRGRIVEISGGSALTQRLMGMGIHIGREVTKVGQFAMQGPVTIRVARATVALGHQMAEKIFIEPHD
jgi:Fe2+ transport system protein FeoA